MRVGNVAYRIDGVNCYLIMREFHSKGLRAAMEKRAELLRPN